MDDLHIIVQNYKKNKIEIKILTLENLELFSLIMANHKSAKKRSMQSITRNSINNKYLTKIRTSINKFEATIKSKNSDEVHKSFSDVNSSMAKAVKRGLIKKQLLSRKLSSLSNQIKKI